MKILNISPTIFSKESVIGGGEKYLTYCQEALENAFREKNRIGEVHIGHPSPIQNNQQSFDLKTFTFYAQNGKPDEFDRDSFASLISTYDVIIVHQCLTKFGMRAASLAKIMNKTVIGFDHGGGEDRNIHWSHDSPYFYDVLVAQSKFASRAFDNFYNKVEIVLGPISLNHQITPQVKNPNEKKFLTIGRILPHKGFEHIINNMPSDATLTVIGAVYDIDYFKYLKECLAKKRKSVDFQHDMSDAEVRQVMNNSNLYIQPSRKIDYKNRFYSKPELLSLASLEALSCGLPTIVSNVGALPELKSIPGCFVYESESHLNQLLNDDYTRFYELTSRIYMREAVAKNYGSLQFGVRLLSILDTLDRA